jgi:formyltetrahydrofolate deformylase
MPSAHRLALLRLSCPDRPGVVARLTAFIASHGGNLLEMQQFTDQLSGWFFTHMIFELGPDQENVAAQARDFQPLAQELGAEWVLRGVRERKRVVLMASRQTHCLADLLMRYQGGELEMDIPLVISNHCDGEALAAAAGVPFAYLPTEGVDKTAHFEAVARHLEEARADLVILARYMQIIPAWLCEAWPARMINIHHSFLPAFAGANPYQRAFERGVKVIGATCHYVTPELDEGPIITQAIEPVEHYHTPADLLRLGRDCERQALAKGVRYHLEDRVLVHGRKTVVFRD